MHKRVTDSRILRGSYRKLKRMAHFLRGQDLWRYRRIQCKKVWLGNEGACWCVCPDNLSASSVVYSFGVGEDVSFDLELIRRFHVQLHAFDPTPRSIEWIRRQTLPTEFVFHECGLADFDGSCGFLPPRNPGHVSHTILQRDSPWPAVELPVQRLVTTMRNLGHDRIDLLKMDVEGAEYGVLADLLSSGVRVGQLLVEFHHRWPEVGIEKTKKAIQELNRAGYQLFDVSATGEEFSFRRIAISSGP
jgi:FkbM family methyltransferase